jgi:DNA polymerase-3 subunit epsilon
MSDTLPIYRWDPWPEGMATAKQIKAKGLLPGPVRGLIPYSKSADGDGYLRVYRLDEATPKPPKSPKQIAALEKMRTAQIASRTCQRCGRVVATKRDLYGGYCEACALIVSRTEARRNAVLWARELRDQPFVILDTETSGLYPGAEVLAISVIDHTGAVLLDTYVKPEHPIVEKTHEEYDEYDWRHREYGPGLTAFGVNGITNAIVADAPSFPDVWGRVVPMLEGKRIVVYNVEFDVGILKTLCHIHKLSMPKPASWHCLMLKFAAYYGEWHYKYDNWAFQTLHTAARTFNISHDHAHTAAGDCFACLEIIRRMGDGCTEHEPKPTNEIKQSQSAPWMFERVWRCPVCNEFDRAENIYDHERCQTCGGKVNNSGRSVPNPHYGTGDGWFFQYQENIPVRVCQTCGAESWQWLNWFMEGQGDNRGSTESGAF